MDVNESHEMAKAEGCYVCQPLVKQRDEMLEIIKAVAHIGVDFGYGVYELEPRHIDKARAILEESGHA